jgi:predicted transcriptional regulator
MPEERGLKLGDLQLAVLKALWELGSGTVAEVHKAMKGGDELAYTTVATLLRRMEARGLVRHREDGRKFVYEPTVSADGVSGSMAEDVLDRLFEGRLTHMVRHLITTRDISREELDELERLIAKRKKEK